MNTRQLVMAVVGTIVKVVVVVIAIVFIYRGALTAYDYGYRLFNEPAMAAEPGVDVKVQITLGKSTLEIGEILQERGLIRDAKLFYIQNLLSHYKDALLPGEYVLNTSMTTEEMMEIMSTAPVEPEETTTPEETGTEESDEGNYGSEE